MSRYSQLAPLASGLLVMQKAKEAGDEAAYKRAMSDYDAQIKGFTNIMSLRESKQRMDIAGAQESYRKSMEPVSRQQAGATVEATQAGTEATKAGTEFTGVQSTGLKTEIMRTDKQWKQLQADTEEANNLLKEYGIEGSAAARNIVNSVLTSTLDSTVALEELRQRIPELATELKGTQIKEETKTVPETKKAEREVAKTTVAKAQEEREVMRLRAEYGILDEAAQNELKAVRRERAKLTSSEVEEQAKQGMDYYSKMPKLVLEQIAAQIGLDKAQALAAELKGKGSEYQAQAMEIAAGMMGISISEMVARSYIIDNKLRMSEQEYQSQIRMLSTAAANMKSMATSAEVYDSLGDVPDEQRQMFALLAGSSTRTLSEADKEQAIKRLDNHMRWLATQAANIYPDIDWNAFIEGSTGVQPIMSDAARRQAAEAIRKALGTQ